MSLNNPAQSGLDAAAAILAASSSSTSKSKHSSKIAEVAALFLDSTCSPLDVYRAASCLREHEIKQVVQLLVFAGPRAILPALRLLNIMRGLPGNWELAMELIEQQKPCHLEEAGQRSMTFIALIGGHRAYRVCDWSAVVKRGLEQGDEEARLSMHMIAEKKWTGEIEPVCRLHGWQCELPYANRPSIWREMQWALYALEMCLKHALHDRGTGEAGDAVASCADSYCWSLPEEYGRASDKYISIYGHFLRIRSPRYAEQREIGSSCEDGNGTDFIITTNVKRALQKVGHALSFAVPAVLEGEAGCGKTAIISFLARKVFGEQSDRRGAPGVTFIQMDSAMSEADGESFESLIGAVVPLPQGGGFRWRPGPIGMAIEKGDWLVFENIGAASSRSSSALAVIAQLASLHAGDVLHLIDGGKPLSVGKGFRCLATKTRTDSLRDENWEPPGGWGIWQRVPVMSLSTEEKVRILKSRYLNVEDCVVRVVRATEQVYQYVGSRRGPLMRQPTFRDAVAVCRRLSHLRAESASLLTVESAVAETLDVLLGWCPVTGDRNSLAQVISDSWSLPLDVATALHASHQPGTSSEGFLVRIGRASLSTSEDGGHQFSAKLTLTGHTRRMLERILRCLQLGEPVLLVGEAGTGKTSLVQELAEFARRKLVVINMSRQSELSDLIGGFRPVDVSTAVSQLAKQFEEVFCITVSRKKNAKFLDALQKASSSPRHLSRSVLLMRGAMNAIPREARRGDARTARKWETITNELTRLGAALSPRHLVSDIKEALTFESDMDREPPKKRQKSAGPESRDANSDHGTFRRKRPRVAAVRRRLDFRFSEGVLVKAMREGHWVLLDEINLAPSELLERLVAMIDRGRLTLPNERGDVVRSAESFRLFATMNPPTDVGKRPLPTVLRTRFAEIYTGDMMNREDIVMVVMHRLWGFLNSHNDDVYSSGEKSIAEDVAEFFIHCCHDGCSGLLQDAAGRPARFSLRNLSRTLDYAIALRKLLGPGPSQMRRALYEGCILAFATSLPSQSRTMVSEAALGLILRPGHVRPTVLDGLWREVVSSVEVKSQLQPVQGFPVKTEKKVMGDNKQPNYGNPSFIVSPTVRRTLEDVSRALTFGAPQLPILLQGPTAAGKTSLVTHLATITGNTLVRINNHEHTDLSDYFGAYVVTPDGALKFHEGPLVQAARNGTWVLLDELNLAPPEVLEALNRLLDDNREIFLAETGERLQAADGFRLFATQNPPGVYAGRKELSKAFRSRFLEIQVPELPDEDLLLILERRCDIPSSFARNMIAVMRELQVRRRASGMFFGREGFTTARDLFRWATRGPRSKEELAVHGYLLLGERARRLAEKDLVRKTIISIVGIAPAVLDDAHLFSFSDAAEDPCPAQECLNFSLQKLGLSKKLLLQAVSIEGVVLTLSMRRMLVLLIHAVANEEPCLLVGATGGGKTTASSLISRACEVQLLTINCHRHTEASDILGNFRPVRTRKDLSEQLFEWVDGPLVSAMKRGSFLLLDEINMADDAVVERLNSVLEQERMLLLSEKGSLKANTDDLVGSLISETVKAHPQFRVLATMNPGGDFGKKELSPALRNRFTEVWIPPPSSVEELIPVAEQSLLLPNCSNEALKIASKAVSEVVRWVLSPSKKTTAEEQHEELSRKYLSTSTFVLSVRDIAAWCNFVRGAVSNCDMHPLLAVLHGARLVFLDGMSVGSVSSADKHVQAEIWQKLVSLVPPEVRDAAQLVTFGTLPEPGLLLSDQLSFGMFRVPSNPESKGSPTKLVKSAFSFMAPCTRRNTARLARAMSVGERPILLEGPPGCGKSSLINALADFAGFSFVRLNLSESTEMSDLLGTDAPGDRPGDFKFREGALLRALRSGSWVLLDELNLASQSVLEGLNSLLDHRRSIFIPEISSEVRAHEGFRVFGAQNPAVDGGGRRGLPKSFLNRFYRVHVESPDDEDILCIVRSLHPLISEELVRKVVRVLNLAKRNLKLADCSGWQTCCGLRDALRWCDLLSGLGERRSVESRVNGGTSSAILEKVGLYFDVVVLQGLRTDSDRGIAERSFQVVFGRGCHDFCRDPSLGTSSHGGMRLGSTDLTEMSSSFCYEKLQPASNLVTRRQLRPLQSMVLAVNAGWPVIVSAGLSEVTESDCSDLVQTLATLSGRRLRTFHGASLTDCDDFIGTYCQQSCREGLENVMDASERLVLRCVSVSSELAKDGTQSVSEEVLLAMAKLATLRKILQTLPEADVSKDIQTEVMEICNVLCSCARAVVSWDSSLEGSVENLQCLLSKFAVLHAQQEVANGISFKWEKSAFVKAVEKGEWILVRNADLCSPAILDRLNPILERPPVAINNIREETPAFRLAPVILAEAPPHEDGSPVLLRPHPEFRIFFSTGSGSAAPAAHGLSRALLDRSLKICLTSSSTQGSSERPVAPPVTGWVEAHVEGCGELQSYMNVDGYRGPICQRDSSMVRYWATERWVSLPNSSKEEDERARAFQTAQSRNILQDFEGLNPRTFEANLALDPAFQLIERDLRTLRLAETKASELLRTICSSGFLPGLKAGLAVLPRFFHNLVPGHVKVCFADAASRGFIMGSQCHEDLTRRAEALQCVVERSTCKILRGIYSQVLTTVSSFREPLSKEFDKSVQDLLPIDPLFALDTAGLSSVPLKDLGMRTSIAKDFRLSIAALQEFRTSWENADGELSTPLSIEESSFKVAKRWVEIQEYDSSTTGRPYEALAYCVLKGIAGAADDLPKMFQTFGFWELPAEGKLINVFLSASELLNLVLQNSNIPIAHVVCLLMEIMDLTKAVNDATGITVFQLTPPLALEPQLTIVENARMDRHMILMPRTESGQQLEARLVELVTPNGKSGLTLTEVDGLVGALASLPIEEVGNDEGVLDVLERFRTAVDCSLPSDRVDPFYLKHWKRASAASAVNRLQNVVQESFDSGEDEYQDAAVVAEVLLHTKCAPDIRVSSLVAMQQYQWVLDLLRNDGKNAKLPRSALQDLQVAMLSNLLVEITSSKIHSQSSDAQQVNSETKQDILDVVGTGGSSVRLHEDCPLAGFSSLKQGRRQSVSAFMLFALGEHALKADSDEYPKLLCHALWSAIRYTELIPLRETKSRNRGTYIEILNRVGAMSRLFLKDCEHPERREVYRLLAETVSRVIHVASQSSENNKAGYPPPLKATETSLRLSGSAWMSLGMLRLKAFTLKLRERNGLDPSDVAKRSTELWLARATRASAGIAAWTSLGKSRLGGDLPSGRIPVKRLDEEFPSLVNRYVQSSHRHVFRPLHSPKFSSLLSATSGLHSVFMKKVIESSFLSRLESDVSTRDEFGRAQEEAIDLFRSCEVAAESLEVSGTFSHFRDISSQLLLSLRELQHGLSGAMQAMALSKVSSSSETGLKAGIFFDISRFPRAAHERKQSVPSFLQSCISIGMSPEALMAFANYVIGCELMCEPRKDSELSEALSTIVHLWKENTLQEESEETRRTSLHVLRSVVVKDGTCFNSVLDRLERDEEKDFIETFNPIATDLECEMLGLADREEDASFEVRKKGLELGQLATISGERFWKIHERAFPTHQGLRSGVSESSFRASAIYELASFLDAMSREIGPVSTYVASAWEMFSSHAIARQFQQPQKIELQEQATSERSCQPFNFYKDTNPEELLRAAEALKFLQRAILKVQGHNFRDSGGHPVLTEVSHAISRVLRSCKLSSSLATVVLGLENVLRHVDEWRRNFATSQTRIDNEVQSVSRLVAQWRRLEMDSWKHLITDRLRAQSDHASRWIFFLYDAIIPQVRSAVRTDDFNREVIAVIDQFLRSSPCGEFEKRLEMVLSLGNHVLVIAGGKQASGLGLGYALRGISQYYGLFLRTVSEATTNAVIAVEAKLNDFSRLVAWDPKANLGASEMISQNLEKFLEYTRLKAAADRTKRKLHSLCLEIDGHLRKPVYEYLTAEVNRIGFETLIADGHPDDFSSPKRPSPPRLSVQLDEALRNLEAELLGPPRSSSATLIDQKVETPNGLLQRLGALEKKLRWFGCASERSALSHCKAAVEVSCELRSAIRSRVMLLKDSKEKGIQPKKRALVELLKTLKRLGLSPFEKAEQLEPDAYSWLSSPQPTHCQSYNEVADSIFVNAARQLRRLKDVADASVRNPDITAAEAKKAKAFCSSLFEHAVAERRSLQQFFTDVSFIIEGGKILQEVLMPGMKGNRNNMFKQATHQEVSDIVRALESVSHDLQVCSSSVSASLVEAKSVNLPEVLSNRTEGLAQMQIRDSAESLSTLQSILKAVIDDIHAFLASAAVMKFQRLRRTGTIVSVSLHESFLRIRVQLEGLRDAVASSVHKAKAVSLQNVAVLVLTPTHDFLSRSLASLHQLGCERQSHSEGKHMSQQYSELLAIGEALVEQALIGSQNIMKSGQGVSSGADTEKLSQNPVTSSPTSWPPDVFTRAHGDVTSLRSFARTGQVSALLRKNIASLSSFLAKFASHKPIQDVEGSRIILLQRNIGCLLRTYTSCMVFPCAKRASAVHCHSLSLLRSLCSMFAGLCAEGFCRPADDTIPQEGSTLEDRRGTGFGDAGDGDMSGARDVSEEVENEEQLIGLQDDGDHDAENGTSDLEKGLDVAGDFEGEVTAMDGNENELDTKQDMETEKQMSAEKGTGEDFVDKSLWNGEEETLENGGEDGFNENSDKISIEPQSPTAHELLGEENGPEIPDQDQRNEEKSAEKAPERKLQAESNEGGQCGNDSNDNDPTCEDAPCEVAAPGIGTELEVKEDDMKDDQGDPAGKNQETGEDNLEVCPQTVEADGSSLADADDASVADEEADHDVTLTGNEDENGSGDADEDPVDKNASDREDPDKVGHHLQETDNARDSNLDEARLTDPKKATSESQDPTKKEDRSSRPNESGNRSEEKSPDRRPTRNDDQRGDVFAPSQDDIGMKTTHPQSASGQPDGNNTFNTPVGTELGTAGEEAGGKSGAGREDGFEGLKDKGAHSDSKLELGRGSNERKEGRKSLESNPMRKAYQEDLVERWTKFVDLICEEREGAKASSDGADYPEGEDGAMMIDKPESLLQSDNLMLGAATEDQQRPVPLDVCTGEEQEPEAAREEIRQSAMLLESNCEGEPQAAPQGEKDSAPDGMEADTAENQEMKSGNDGKQPNPRRNRVDTPTPASRREDENCDPMAIDDDQNVLEEGDNDVHDHNQRLEPETKQALTDEDARTSWQALVQRSWPGANMLCEQLRLVLEPKVASGLAGGYKTGKRLNIRKVIEFVASDYRKDKIWLRRVKPDKRSYDVLLAIDDSESMVESGAGSMALEALALVTSAMSKLEVGRLAVASFGAEARIIRGFNEPLSVDDDAGSRLIKHFSFSQSDTNVTRLLSLIQSHMSLQMDSDSVEHIKLAFVISDGRLSSRDQVKQQLTGLKEENILVAFVIVDSVQSKESSIFEVRRVEYDRKGKIRVLPYMKDFPVDFYTVVQDISSLPVVLADCLRQWMELATAQE